MAIIQATDSDDPALQEQSQPVAETSPTQPESQSSAESDSNVVGASQSPPEQESTATPDLQEEPATLAQTDQSDQSDQAEPTQEADESHQDQAEPEQPRPDPASDQEEPDDPLTGFTVPIAGACITEFAGHLPGADRAYRNDGVHEGLDFYEWASCTAVNVAVEVLAAKAGVVIRADLDYVDITPADWDRFEQANFAGAEILDELRGRQVWIDHGHGIVTRYAHLSAIADGIAAGVEVQQGQLIGFPGESGQREVYANPGADIHLHFEIRIADAWLGQGESAEAARQLYLRAFGLTP